MVKKLFLFTLLATSFTPAKALNTHEIRTWGLVTAGVLVTWAGVHVLIRQNYDITNKMFDVITGLVLISAGITGIVLSDRISREIEHAFR